MTTTGTSLTAAPGVVPVDELLESITAYQPRADVDVIRQAYDFASTAHADQTRKSGAPYFSHPTDVAHLLVQLKMDAASVCAALLHDVVEDTDCTVNEIHSLFGPEVAFLVDGVTKLSRANFSSRQDRAAESFRKMLIAMARDVRVLIVKLCDRLDNMRTMQFMKTAAQERISRETMDIYVPLANRLGVYRIKTELEDLAFQYLYPEAFEQLGRQYQEIAPSVDEAIEQFAQQLEEDISRQGFAAQVSGQPRHLFSIYQNSLGTHDTAPRLNDLLMFTIVVESLNDCYSVMGALHARYTPVPGTIRDYIALPKPNLYRSIHTTVIGPKRRRAVVKIRTHEMDRIASHGILHDWRYGSKLTGGPAPNLVSQIAWLRDLASLPQDIQSSAEFLDSVKTDLFQKEVYAFTPKGEPRVFPQGATVVDFAYAIHTEIGHHCSAALVNSKPTSLSYALQDGDIVEISTNPTQRPSRNWLGFVATARARTQIRTYLRNQERDRSEMLGKELLDAELHQHGISSQRLLADTAATNALLKRLDLEHIAQVYRAIGFGKLAPATVYQNFSDLNNQPNTSTSIHTFREGLLEQAVRRLTGRASAPPMISDLDEVIIRYASCCHPVPGDDIVGVLTRSEGITVHRRECPAALDVPAERRFMLRWNPKRRPHLPVDLRVVTANKPGILGKLGATFQQHEVNVDSFSGRRTADTRSVILFSFACSDLHRLQPLLRALRKIRGVYQVERA